MQELLEEALATLIPSDAEQAAVAALCDSLLARARKAAPDGVKPLLVGSVAKGTWLPGADIDLFLRFPEGADLKAEGLALARAVLPDGEELYDLLADPREHENLARVAGHGEVLAELRELLARRRSVASSRGDG